MHVVPDCCSYGGMLDSALRIERPDGFSDYIALHAPPFPQAGYAILIDPSGATKSIIYATRSDVTRLAQTAVRLLLESPPFSEDFAVWCTSEARAKCSNQDMGRLGVKTLPDF